MIDYALANEERLMGPHVSAIVVLIRHYLP